MFIEQCKGKMHDKIASSKQPHYSEEFYASIKLDGHYTQIHVDHMKAQVRFFTSGGKEFSIDMAERNLLEATKSLDIGYIVLEAEYTYRCKGILGDRVNSAMLTTYRTDFVHKRACKGSMHDTFHIFNIIDNSAFEERVKLMQAIQPTANVEVATQRLMTYEEAQLWTKSLVAIGWEGSMLQTPDTIYEPGKRLNSIIKIKYRPEIVVEVITELEGEGRLSGMIGALECRILETDVTFKVGSGLDDYMRSLWGAFLGQYIEVEYEQLSADGVPLQPTFKRRVGDR